MKRPLGITILALSKFASGLFFIVFGVWRANGDTWSSTPKQFSFLIFAIWFGVAIWEVSLGIGLWRLWNWARTLVLIVGAFWAAEFLLKLPDFFLHHRVLVVGHWYYWLGLLWPVLNIVILIYLMLPHVQRAFRESRLPKA
jgi:hypothetical protein